MDLLPPNNLQDSSNLQSPGDFYIRESAMKESGGNPEAQAKGSSAGGLYGFTTPTWNSLIAKHPDLGLTPEGRFDPTQATTAMRVFTMDNASYLVGQGIDPSDANLRMAHFLGPGGAAKFIPALQANPNASAAALFPREAEANRSVFFNRDGSPRTLSQVYAQQTSAFGGAGENFPNQPSQPPQANAPDFSAYTDSVQAASKGNDQRLKQQVSNVASRLPDLSKPLEHDTADEQKAVAQFHVLMQSMQRIGMSPDRYVQEALGSDKASMEKILPFLEAFQEG